MSVSGPARRWLASQVRVIQEGLTKGTIYKGVGGLFGSADKTDLSPPLDPEGQGEG